MWCGSLPAACAELGDPRERPEAEPVRREEAVEEDERRPEPRVPDAPAPLRDGRLGLHAVVVASRRSVTTRMIRCEISSIDSSLTSITGQPSRRWIRCAYSSSS